MKLFVCFYGSHGPKNVTINVDDLKSISGCFGAASQQQPLVYESTAEGCSRQGGQAGVRTEINWVLLYLPEVSFRCNRGLHDNTSRQRTSSPHDLSVWGTQCTDVTCTPTSAHTAAHVKWEYSHYGLSTM